jgi:hypothetical protein
MVIHGWSAVPYWDQWDDLILDPKQVFSPWLYSQHNEHRLLFPRLLFAIDTFVFNGTNKFNYFCNLALPLVLASLILWVARGHSSRKPADTFWIAGIVLTMLFSAMQFENFLWGFQVQFFLVEVAAVASICCIVLSRHSLLSVGGSVAFSTISTYSLASGVIVPLLAIALAFWAGRSKAQIAVLGVAAATLLGVYLIGYASPDYHLHPLRILLRRDLLVYVAAELGNPLGQLLRLSYHRHYTHFYIAFGALGFVSFVAITLIYFRRGCGRAQLVFLGIAAFAVGVTVLTAVGRIRLGVGSASATRYASPMLLFWLSLAMLGILETERRPRLRPVAIGVSGLVLFALAHAQSSFVKTGLAWVQPRWGATAALLADVDDADALGGAYPNPNLERRLAAELRTQRLSIFADDWSTWLGAPLSDHVRIGDPTECRGGIDRVERLPVSGPRAEWRVSGWAWDNSRDAPPVRIAIADSAGRVVGYALAGFSAPPARPRHSGWRGDFTAGDARSITAYALVDRGRAACPVTLWAAAP